MYRGYAKQTSKTMYLEYLVAPVSQTGSVFVDLISESYTVLRWHLHASQSRNSIILSLLCQIKLYPEMNHVCYLAKTCCFLGGVQGLIVLVETKATLLLAPPFEFLRC